MTTAEAISILTSYNSWRRGAETDIIDVVKVKDAIDKAIEVMQEQVNDAGKMIDERRLTEVRHSGYV